MDLILYVIVILAGIIPPVATGWWAYRMGLQGRAEALALRDQALDQVRDLRAEILAVEARLRAGYPTIPPIPTPPTPEAIAAAIKPLIPSAPKLPDIPTAKDIAAAMPPYPDIPTAKDIAAAMPPYPDIPTKEEISASVTGAVNGALGRLLQSGAAAGREEIATIEASVPAGDRIQNAILSRITKLLSGD